MSKPQVGDEILFLVYGVNGKEIWRKAKVIEPPAFFVETKDHYRTDLYYSMENENWRRPNAKS